MKNIHSLWKDIEYRLKCIYDKYDRDIDDYREYSVFVLTYANHDYKGTHINMEEIQ